MGAANASETPLDFGGRIALAITEEKTTRSKTERDLALGRGRIQRLLGLGKNPILSPGPDVIRKLADYLHVSYEWLAIGRGPMRAEHWAPSSFEQAVNFAHANGTREDAIQAAAERFRDEAGMNAWDWVLAIDGEARRLERTGAPRPEAIAKKQAAVRREQSKRRKRADESAAAVRERLARRGA